MIYVPAEGPSNAKIVVLGEAPGQEEEREGRPFVGATGRIVRETLNELGIDDREVYFTNVVKVRPPGNNIDALKIIGKKIEDFIPQLHEEIHQLKPNVILALGNTALQATTGHKGIEKYRGSILPCCFGPYKVVASIHPAAILHGESEGMKSWKDLTPIKWDFARAISQSKFPEYDPPRRNLMVCRSALDLHRFLDRYRDRGEYPFVSVDIETYKTFPLCVGIAFNKDEALSVPLFNLSEEGMTRSDQIFCWQELAKLLADLNTFKIGQNFKFDQRLLHFCHNDEVLLGLKVRSFFFDTMLAFQTLYPELPGRLQFSTSVLTEEPYYKDEGKEYNPKRDKFDRLLLYNAKDAAVTFEVFEREIQELEERNLSKFFFDKIMPLHDFYSKVELRGIKRDNQARKELGEKYNTSKKNLQEELNSLTSEYLDDPINVNSNGRNGDVPKLLFGLMRIPIRKGTDEKTLDALMRNAVKDVKKKRILELILEIRKVKKTIGTYIDHDTDYRGRTLTSVRIALETGRTSNGVLKPPVAIGTKGLAFQTITKHGDVGNDLRKMFVPDPGYIFIEPDLSSAEARVVAILANDERLLKIFKYDLDLHRITTGWLYDSCPDELLNKFFEEEDEITIQDLKRDITKYLKDRIDNELRQVGKKFRHAGHYDMKKREASRQTGFSEWKSGQNLDKFHDTNPKIRGAFHEGIKKALGDNNRILVSPHGRERQFLNKWGDDLFKEAYAFIPQATVSDHLKFAARRIEKRAPWVQILAESHDSFLAQIPEDSLNCTKVIIKEELEVPINFSKCSLPRGELVIPCEIKIGKENWEEMEIIE